VRRLVLLPPACVVALLLGAAPLAVAAQTMRTFTVERKTGDTPRLRATVEFGAGELSLGPATRGMLYSAEMRYDQERASPQHRFDAQSQQLDLRLRPIGNAGVRVTNREQLAQRAVVTLAPDLPLDLDVTLGAGEGQIQLGGLKLRRAAIHSVATRTVIRVDRPNSVECETLDLDGGAAEVYTEQLGNLRCAEIRFDGGVGQTRLDLTGRWTSTLRLSAKQALGTLTLVLPKDAGVRIVLDRTLSSFEPTGFTKAGNAWVSTNFQRSPRTILVDVTSAVGGLVVEWE
jgi:hypothetical protein